MRNQQNATAHGTPSRRSAVADMAMLVSIRMLVHVFKHMSMLVVFVFSVRFFETDVRVDL